MTLAKQEAEEAADKLEAEKIAEAEKEVALEAERLEQEAIAAAEKIKEQMLAKIEARK